MIISPKWTELYLQFAKAKGGLNIFSRILAMAGTQRLQEAVACLHLGPPRPLSMLIRGRGRKAALRRGYVLHGVKRWPYCSADGAYVWSASENNSNNAWNVNSGGNLNNNNKNNRFGCVPALEMHCVSPGIA